MPKATSPRTPARVPQAILQPIRPAWVEISASALRHNYTRLRDQAESIRAGIICVVKANAYGHGLLECARVLGSEGADWFAVTSVDEGVELVSGLHVKGQEFKPPRVLVLSGIFSLEDARRAIRHQLTPVALSLQQVEWLAKAAGTEPDSAANTPTEDSHAKFAFHLEIDTGMARNGIRWDDTAQQESVAELLGASPSLHLEGLLTHLASPDDPSSPQTRQQLQRFQRTLAHLHAHGVRPPLLHVGNSITLFDASQTDALAELAHMFSARLLLRPGLALYGYGVEGMRPVLAWKTRVTSLRRLQAGDGVSYNATFHTRRATTVATLATGYADGYNRLLSNKGSVIIRGQRASVLGRVTMDQIMVDVTQIDDVAIGDEAVLLGTQGEFTIAATQLATLTGTIPWEVLCDISSRVARVLVE